jgi:hypothetical protein
MCCKQSVVTALADLERLGFVTRIRRINTPLGFTTRQITNACKGARTQQRARTDRYDVVCY